MSYVIAVVAALLVGTGLVLQQKSAEQAPKAYFLRLRLIAELLHQPQWLAGVAIMGAGQVLSGWVFGHLDLSVAEPLLASNLIFALLLAVPLSGQALRKTELIGAVVLGLGVAALSLVRDVDSQSTSFGSFAYWPAAAGIAAVAWLLVMIGRKRSGRMRATLTGCASGLVFGIADALTRRTVQLAEGHPLVSLLGSWPLYSLIAASLIGMWLMASSFNSAPLHASLPTITAAEPVTGIALGIVVFGDVVRISPAVIAVQAAGLAALIVGVIMVSRAPALTGLRHPHLIHPRYDKPAKAPRAQPSPARTAPSLPLGPATVPLPALAVVKPVSPSEASG